MVLNRVKAAKWLTRASQVIIPSGRLDLQASPAVQTPPLQAPDFVAFHFAGWLVRVVAKTERQETNTTENMQASGGVKR